jgi:hypothetical protein
MEGDKLEELATLSVFQSHLTCRDLRKAIGKPMLSEWQKNSINHILRNMKLEIVESPKPFHGRNEYCYITVSLEPVMGLDTSMHNVDYNKLAFVLCFIYVSHQSCLKKDILANTFILESDLDAMKKHSYIEMYKDQCYWGVRSRVSFTHETVIDCLNAIYQKDMSAAIKKSGIGNGSFEIN